ncbi:MAG TPA: hypothetical protein DDW76_18290 [Cyanobacteria bacterium UBA11369]|nr:hypothetical protein [Cyanobacteria bacterium UBA11371]HBE31153.1 hypothetical protein [Cyanobacteria bacterium UBA11368]HBE50664.1 hypothetical protein [Cyanobacteria bacterium UBA11369]
MDNLSPDELDKRLLELAKSAQQHPSGSQERRIALTKLVAEINRQSNRLTRPKSNKLICPNSIEYPAQLFSEVFALALQKLLFFIYQPDTNIDSYNPEQGTVRTWLNVKLDRRFFQEASNELLGVKFVAGKFKTLRISKLEDLDLDVEDITSPDDSTSLTQSEIIKKCIEEDPEGIFRNERIGNNPRANFLAIALKRFEGNSWKEISEELGIDALSTTSSFYSRCVKKFAPKIKAYLQENV